MPADPTRDHHTFSGWYTAANGGGVSVWGESTFTKQAGGTIYGSNAASTLKNTTTSSDYYGHAVFVYVSSGERRNTTAWVRVSLDSGVSGSDGGWE
jgi:hypothetical protein